MFVSDFLVSLHVMFGTVLCNIFASILGVYAVLLVFSGFTPVG